MSLCPCCDLGFRGLSLSRCLLAGGKRNGYHDFGSLGGLSTKSLDVILTKITTKNLQT